MIRLIQELFPLHKMGLSSRGLLRFRHLNTGCQFEQKSLLRCLPFSLRECNSLRQGEVEQNHGHYYYHQQRSPSPAGEPGSSLICSLCGHHRSCSNSPSKVVLGRSTFLFCFAVVAAVSLLVTTRARTTSHWDGRE